MSDNVKDRAVKQYGELCEACRENRERCLPKALGTTTAYGGIVVDCAGFDPCPMMVKL